MSNNQTSIRVAGTLGEMTKGKAKKGRTYDLPEPGIIGVPCQRGKHSNCWVKKCSCDCHHAVGRGRSIQ